MLLLLRIDFIIIYLFIHSCSLLCILICSFSLKEFLPVSFIKVKNIEKKIFAEHRQHMGISDLEAKAMYTKNARDLNTYGVTFFLVKEKMSGKNKLVPRLLGVTKDCVLRLDERTKEPIKSWPLTTVRRWAASQNTFTLDFGDYAEQYYSVQTTEGEQIAQLIAGYIDIILKKVSLIQYCRWIVKLECIIVQLLTVNCFYFRNNQKIIWALREMKGLLCLRTTFILVELL